MFFVSTRPAKRRVALGLAGRPAAKFRLRGHGGKRMETQSEFTERRQRRDRRKSRLPTLQSLFANRRRRTIRRESDRRGLVLLDHYGRSVLVPAFAVVALSLADALLTLYLLGKGAMELNPVMNFFLKLGPAHFLLAKYCLTAFSVLIIVLLNYVFIRRLRLHVRSLLVFFAGGFLLVICWEVFLVIRHVV